MGVFNNYAIVPADKFMPIDVHVPGCPPRPEALMHGILKLRKMIQDDPDLRLARALRRARAPRRSLRRGARRCLTRSGLELIAQAARARRSPAASIATTFFRDRATLESRPQRDPRRARRAARAGGYRSLMSVHGVDYYPEEPRLGVLYELLDMERVDRLTVKLRVPHRRAGGRVGDAGLADRRPPGARGLRHVRRASSTGHPDLRRILMPEDYEGHPQRRDFPIGGEPVLFTHNDATSPGWTR